MLTHTALCELLKPFSAKVVECMARQASSVPAILRDPEHRCQQAGTAMGPLLLVFPTELPAGAAPLQQAFSVQGFPEGPSLPIVPSFWEGMLEFLSHKCSQSMD